MILITAQGRLAHQPEIKILPGGTSCCEFRLISTRFAKGEEHLEAVNFVCYGDDAERFCDNTEKGQLISASGTQETQRYRSGDQERQFVKYRLTWFEKGAKPRGGQRPASADRRPPAGDTRETPRSESRPVGRQDDRPSNGFVDDNEKPTNGLI